MPFKYEWHVCLRCRQGVLYWNGQIGKYECGTCGWAVLTQSLKRRLDREYEKACLEWDCEEMGK